MEPHLQVIGILLIILSLLHIVFPRYFNWKAELAALSLVNRQMMGVHTFFIALMVLLMGILCLTESNALVGTPLGKKVALGLAVFWTARLLVQFFGYSPALWRGKPFETAIHFIFSVFWVYLSGVFWMVYFN